ncbi:MAG: ion channel [Bacteroidales bacterium]
MEPILNIFNIILLLSIIVKVFHDIYTAEEINSNILLTTFCGYIILGMIGFVIFLSIENNHPNSFAGLEEGGTFIDDLFYFTYVSILTIEYGDITLITPLARKATILILLISNFYSIVVMALVIGKYLAYQKTGKTRNKIITNNK